MPAGLHIQAGGMVAVREAKRLVPPVQWKHEDVKRWLNSTNNGQFADVVPAPDLDGRSLVRMTALALARLFGGNTKKGQLLYDAVHDHVAYIAKQLEQMKGRN